MALNRIWTILPDIVAYDLSHFIAATPVEISQFGEIFFISYGLMQIPCGAIIDRYGPRRTLGLSTLVIGLSGITMAFSRSILEVDLERLIIGAASGFSFVGSAKVIQVWFLPHRFATLLGICLALGNLGLISTAPLQFISSHWGWRSMLFLLGLFSALVGSLTLVELLGDPSGARIIPSPVPAHDVGHLAPLIRNGRALERQIQYLLNCLLATAVAAPIFTFGGLYASTFLQAKYGLTSLGASEAITGMFAGVVGGGLFWGWHSDRLGSRKRMQVIGSIGVAAALAMLFYAPGLPLVLSILLLFMIGFLGMSADLSFATVKEMFPASSSLALGAMSTFASLGCALILQLVFWNMQGEPHLHGMHEVPNLLAEEMARGLFPILLVAIALGIPAALLIKNPIQQR